MDHVIAIDGPAGSGKSTVARAVADQLGWSFLDTGAMYRAITALALRTNVDVHDHDAMAALASGVVIETVPATVIDGIDVSDEIRSAPVNDAVSVVASQPLVRAAMVRRQQECAKRQPRGTVVEGRDITTVVFPNAVVKVYLTASLEERSRRRVDEDVTSVSRRDQIDSNRPSSPLRQADDALYIDTTGRAIASVVEEIVTCLNQRS